MDSQTIRSYRNDAFAGFDLVLDDYLGPAPGVQISEIIVAIAGPVSGGKGRLTNRPWSFDQDKLAARFDGAKAHLLNDLAALGQASPFLEHDHLDPVFQPAQVKANATQSLIVGIGTGFNVSPVLQIGTHVECLNVEYGHVRLHSDVTDVLRATFGEKAAPFETVEHVFSGRGYAAVAELFKTRKDPALTSFEVFYAQLLARLTRNLMLAFLPAGGVFFAGAVARTVLSSSARTAFLDILQAPYDLDAVLAAPIYAILDDAAALKGCATYRFEA